MNKEIILEMRGIDKSFPGVHVLDGVHLTLYPGEVHALMGENGAGKSTLMNILMGIHSADAGEIFFQGKSVVFKNPKEAMEAGIAMIHQELNPILDMRVYENLFVGREIANRFGLVDKKKMISETERILDEIGIHLSATAVMRDLSVAQCQLIEIAKAISIGAKVIIMDEPTSAITETEVETLFTQIRKLKQSGCAILYISHKMEEIFQICDRITVLRDGQYIGSDLAQNLNENDLIKMMVGREINDVYPKTEHPIGEVIFKADSLNWKNRVKQVSFELRSGEILGFAGLVGAGRSEVAECVFGLHPEADGECFVMGEAISMKSPKQAIQKKISFVTEDRKQTGLNLQGSVLENITIVSLEQLFPNRLLSKRKEEGVAADYIDKLRIKTPSARQLVSNLSGGNQQKVVLAKWLLTEPDIIILDEPTRGIDVGAKRDIYLLIGELAKRGKGVVMISSEIAELMGLCDRILVMSEGRISGELKAEEYSQEAIMHMASGLTS